MQNNIRLTHRSPIFIFKFPFLFVALIAPHRGSISLREKVKAVCQDSCRNFQKIGCNWYVDE
jgi:hypothetical protein